MTILAGACLVIALIPLFAVLFYVISQGVGRLDGRLVYQAASTSRIEGRWNW
jgi:hypothetical protein